jgi:uncharacterized damage-inducible protein DinB
MAENNATLDTFYRHWKEYQDSLKAAIAPLTDEQLALSAMPGYRNISQIVAHMISGRLDWFCGFLGEPCGEAAPLIDWGRRDAPQRTAAELVDGLDLTWQLMADCLNRWSSDDMAKTYPHEWRGDPYDLTRSWVVWHILEHDLHHGGELSLTLGIHGLQAPDV